MRQPLTKRQRELLDYVSAFIGANGFSPSFQEIAEHFGYRSLSTVHEHVYGLEKKGYLRRRFNTPRALEVIDPNEVWIPKDGGAFEIPPDVRYVPVAALPQLFRAWLQKRQAPDLPPLPTDTRATHA
jgi:SOS-response transcriptional repressor LexA